jgi:hypothetical protein
MDRWRPHSKSRITVLNHPQTERKISFMKHTTFAIVALFVTAACNNESATPTGVPMRSATQLAFTAEPGNAAVGATLGTVTLAAEDPAGKVDATWPGNADIALRDAAGAVIPDTTLFLCSPSNSVGGLSCFRGSIEVSLWPKGQVTVSDFSVNKAGTYTLVATDRFDALAAGKSQSFTVK